MADALYVTTAEMKTILNLTGSTYDAELDLAVSAASRGIDARTGRRFSADTSASSRTFYTLSPAFLTVGDFLELSSVSWLYNGALTDFKAELALVPSPPLKAGPPWGALRTVPDNTTGTGLTALPSSSSTITVTAKWGWPAVPDAVKQAARILAARYFRRPREAAFGVAGLGVDSSAVYVSKYDPDVDALLEPYCLRGFDI